MVRWVEWIDFYRWQVTWMPEKNPMGESGGFFYLFLILGLLFWGVNLFRLLV